MLVGRLERQAADLTAAVATPVQARPALAAKAVQLGDDHAATGAARWKRKIQRLAGARTQNPGKDGHAPLSLAPALRTSAGVESPTDIARRTAKRERARRRDGDLFLYARAFADCAERGPLSSGSRPLLVTATGFEWTARAAQFDAEVRPLEALQPRSADRIVAVGVLDLADDPALAAFILHQALRPGGLLIGAAIGGRSLERMRAALLEAERAAGRVAQRFRPMPDAVALAALLTGAGLRDVVIEVDRVRVAYRGLDQLVSDLRDIGCTGGPPGPVPYLQRTVAEAARSHFLGGEQRVEERFEILNFSAASGNAV